MNSAWGDVRYSLRTLLRNPGFTAVALITLALGIGANTAIFSVVNGILPRPLPFPNGDRLVSICETNPAVAGFCIASPPNVEDWSRSSRTLEALGVGRDWPFILKADEGAEGLDGGIATPEFFQVLGIKPALGRLFLPEDLEPGRNRVLVLSHELWQSRFGGDPSIIDRSLTVSNASYTVVGVLPAGLQVPELEWVEIWAPLHFDPRDEEMRQWRGFKALGRLSANASLKDAQDELDAIALGLAEQYPATNEGWGIAVRSLHDEVVGSVRPALLVFLGAVGFVLLIGCANVANLLLARATGRGREFAIRAAIGAGRGRLMRLLLTESLLLSVSGGAAGVLLSLWAVEAFVSLAPGSIPRLDEVSLDGSVLIFAALLAVLTTVLFGLAPALHAVGIDLTSAIKEGDQRAPGRSGLSLRSALVVTEVALALILLIGAGLLIQSFTRLLRWEPGFEQENLTTVWLLASQGKYSDGDQVASLFRQSVQELESLPSVVSVGRASAGPLFGGRETDEFLIGGRPVPAPGERPAARWYDVGPNYFRTLGLPLRRGRLFSEADARGAPQVAIINESMARRHWAGADPIGQQVTMYERTMTIVGIVGDVQPFRPGAPVASEIYWPQDQQPRWATFMVIRTDSDPAAIVRAARQRLQRLDSDLQIGAFRTIEDLIGRQLIRPRFNMLLLVVFAGIALALAAIGIYGVISYSVAQRTREIGLRVALGAERQHVLISVVRRGMAPALLGIAIGVVGAFALTRLMTSLLVGVGATDPLTFSVVVLTLALIALLACYAPARRATAVSPMEALRHE